MGLEPYYVQQSLADVRKEREGDRSFHWAKDLAVPPREFHLDVTRQAAVLVDVDYYIDMPKFLARHPGTYFIFAFQPTACACSRGEFSFRFLDDGKVQYRVSGGAEYVHEVWDYGGDTLVVEDIGYFRKTVVAYHFDRKYVGTHHALIMLSVIGRFECPALVPTPWLIEGKRLERLRPVIGDHAVLDIVQSDGLHRSVARLGSHEAVTLPKSLFDKAHAVAMIAKVPLTPAMVSSNVFASDASGLPTERLPPGWAAILADYTRAGVPWFPPVVYPPTECCLRVEFGKYDYDAPVALAGFGSPLIGPCYDYVITIAADDVCIRERVEKFASDTPEPEVPFGTGQDIDSDGPVPSSLAGYMIEFSQRLIPTPHQGHPADDDDVRERQDRPSQRAMLDELSVLGDNVRDIVKSFEKKETSVAVKDPRAISQMPKKLDYSRFLYAFHDTVMFEQAWYAFNKTPAEIAERVCLILQAALHSVLADGSRFDGHVKRRARILERICIMRFFAPEHHSALCEAMDAQIALPGVTTEGRRYQTGYTRGSGSLETSDFNSILTAFIDYCAWRNTTVAGAKCCPDMAWSMLGIYGGDDSLAGAVDPKALKRSAELMGQDYGIKVVPRGELGVAFLNRQFGPDVWTGDPNSMSNPSRLLSKLWVGPANLKQPLTRFGERASGYFRMDRNSPVIGEICAVSHELLGDFVDGVLMPWDGKRLESNWPNEDSGWMVDVFEKSIPDFDRDRYWDWICDMRATRNPDLLLRAPLCTSAPTVPTEVKHPCVVGDDLLRPPDSPPGDAPSDPDDKGKEEAWEPGDEDAPSVDSEVVARPASLEEFEAAAALPRVVLDAAALVPLVGANGKRISETRKSAAAVEASEAVKAAKAVKSTFLPAVKTAAVAKPAQAAKAAPAACTHKKKANPKGGAYPCPCTWKPRKKEAETTVVEHAKYTADWLFKRDLAAKKHGLTRSEREALPGAEKLAGHNK
jgi:hypothetical protein